MRITLATETYFPQLNGVSRTLGHLVRTLEEAGDHVQVVHPDYRTEPVHAEIHTVRSINPPFYRELFLPVPPFRKLGHAVDRFQPDLIHVATEATLGLAMLRYARSRRLPIVSSFHTHFDQYTHHYRIGFLRGAIWRYLRWFHNSTLATYVPSRSTIELLQRRKFERMELWPRGVDANLFRPDRPGRSRVRDALQIAPDEIVVAHVSRIAAEKNVAYLADALDHLTRHAPGTRLLIVGDGPARPELEARLGASASFVGYRTGDDLADHYAAADLFAFASRTETFGNVVLEALASGLPVVALKAGGPADTVQDGRTGHLVEPDDPPQVFAQRLADLVTNPAQRQHMAQAARAYALEQSWDHIMLALRQHYRQAIADQPQTAG